MGVQSVDIPLPDMQAAKGSSSTCSTSSSTSSQPSSRPCVPVTQSFFSCDNPHCSRMLVDPAVLSCGHVVCGSTCVPGGCLATGRCRITPDTSCTGADAAVDAASADAFPASGLRSGTGQHHGSADLLPGSVHEPQMHGAQMSSVANGVIPTTPTGSVSNRDAPTASVATGRDSPTDPLAEKHAASQQKACGSGPGETNHNGNVLTADDVRCPACLLPVMGVSQPCIKLDELLVQLYPKQQAARRAETQQLLASCPTPSQSIQNGSEPVAGDGCAVIISSAPRAGPRTAASSEIQELLRHPQPITQLWPKLRKHLSEHADTSYTWHMVGCDDCGVYPIVGRRYRCLHCREDIGYDLCGACYDRGLAGRGRFNQKHTPDH